MLIIGCDYYPGFQQIAYVDKETGEYQERRLRHPEEAEKFYRALWEQSVQVRVGMEASGHSRWFERLLEGLSFELWTGDAAKIRAKLVRKKKTDREDARHILDFADVQLRRRAGNFATVIRTIECVPMPTEATQILAILDRCCDDSGFRCETMATSIWRRRGFRYIEWRMSGQS
jgi:hypothetical protein